MTNPLFGRRRPRGFNHEYIYSRRDKKRSHLRPCHSPGCSPCVDNGVIDGKQAGNVFMNAAGRTRRRKAFSLRYGINVSTGLAVLLIVLLAVAWKLLLS